MEEAKSFVLLPNDELRDEGCKLVGIAPAARISSELILAGQEH